MQPSTFSLDADQLPAPSGYKQTKSLSQVPSYDSAGYRVRVDVHDCLWVQNVPLDSKVRAVLECTSFMGINPMIT
jgi:hypothetical protein